MNRIDDTGGARNRNATSPPETDGAVETVRRFWDEFLYDDVRVAVRPAGTVEHFAELEEFRVGRLDYLPRHVDFGAWRGKRVLEIGCRIGLDLIRFARGGARATGIELAPSRLEEAKRYFDMHGLAGDFRVMNGEAMSFPDGSFDLVYAHGVLPYTPDPARMIGEIHRVLAPGGEMFLMAYNRYSWLTLLSKLSGKNLRHEEAPVFRSYSPRELRKMLAGFSRVEIVPERFPAETGLHRGAAARFVYSLLLGLFRITPERIVRPFGAHLVVKAVR